MIRIRLEENLILKEAARSVDRIKNEMSITLVTEPIYGSTYSANIAAQTTRDVLWIPAAKNQRLWDLNKDSTQQEFIQNTYNFLDYYYPTCIEWFAWLDAAETETVPNPIPNGDPITQRVPFSGDQSRIDELKSEVVMGNDFLLFRHLYDLGIRNITLEDI